MPSNCLIIINIKKKTNLNLFVEISLVPLAPVSLDPLLFLLRAVFGRFAHTLDDDTIFIGQGAL